MNANAMHAGWSTCHFQDGHLLDARILADFDRAARQSLDLGNHFFGRLLGFMEPIVPDTSRFPSRPSRDFRHLRSCSRRSNCTRADLTTFEDSRTAYKRKKGANLLFEAWTGPSVWPAPTLPDP